MFMWSNDFVDALGFNRYMVECELTIYQIPLYLVRSFNRYMVECELNDMYQIVKANKVLIDTWWNVNFIIS